MTRRDEIEARRILARYRRLILLGRVQLPPEAARPIVGPDCAYHLYGLTGPGNAPSRSRTPSRRDG